MTKIISHVKALPAELAPSSIYLVKPDNNARAKFVVTSATGTPVHLDVLDEEAILAALRNIPGKLAGIEENMLLSSVVGIDGQNIPIQAPGGDYPWTHISSPITTKDWSAASSPYYGTVIGSIQGAIFRATKLQQANCDVMMGTDCVVGRKVYPFINWMPLGNTFGTVRWGIEYCVAKNHGQMVFTDPVTIYIEDYVYYNSARTNMVSVVSEANAVPGIHIEPDSVIKMRIFRDGAHKNDTYAGEAAVWAGGVKHQVARLGTRNKVPVFF